MNTKVTPTAVPLESVSSSNISQVGYDPESSTLAVRFSNGTLYHYAGVPRETYDEFRAADSLGRFHSRRIKHGFESTKIDESEGSNGGT